jgi:hypothetical protein
MPPTCGTLHHDIMALFASHPLLQYAAIPVKNETYTSYDTQAVAYANRAIGAMIGQAYLTQRNRS